MVSSKLLGIMGSIYVKNGYEHNTVFISSCHSQKWAPTSCRSSYNQSDDRKLWRDITSPPLPYKIMGSEQKSSFHRQMPLTSSRALPRAGGRFSVCTVLLTGIPCKLISFGIKQKKKSHFNIKSLKGAVFLRAKEKKKNKSRIKE